MEGFPDDLSPVQSVWLALLELQMTDERDLIANARLSALHTEHDNRNGGTDDFDIQVRGAVSLYVVHEPRVLQEMSKPRSCKIVTPPLLGPNLGAASWAAIYACSFWSLSRLFSEVARFCMRTSGT